MMFCGVNIGHQVATNLTESLNPPSFLLTVQDITEYTETAEENSHNEEEEEEEEEVSVCEPFINDRVPVAEVVRCVEELKVEPTLREVHTPPPRVPAKLLPRLGSLDSEYHTTIYFNLKRCSECRLASYGNICLILLEVPVLDFSPTA